MAAKAVPVVRADYPKTWFAAGATALAGAAAYSAWSALDSIEEFGRYFWGGAAVLACILLFAIFLPPLFTSHRLGARGIRVRMGLLIDVTVPYEWIVETRHASVKRGTLSFGLGVKYSGASDTVYVLSTSSNLISVVLDAKHGLGGFMRPDVSQLVLSVKDPSTVMDVIRERSGQAFEEA